MQINSTVLFKAFEKLLDSGWAEKVITPLKRNVELCFKIQLLVCVQSEYPQMRQ